MQDINLNVSLKAKNDLVANEIKTLFKKNKILCINIMGAPGAGKTEVIEQTATLLKGVLVVQGDLKSSIDTQRLNSRGIRCVQINTHSGCHLNAELVKTALVGEPLEDINYIFIENVGNLVCPAGVLLGQHLNIIISSTTEGVDKPLKYPHIYHDSQAIILSKYDLKDAVEFDERAFLRALGNLVQKRTFLKTSKKDSTTFVALEKYIRKSWEELYET